MRDAELPTFEGVSASPEQLGAITWLLSAMHLGEHCLPGQYSRSIVSFRFGANLTRLGVMRVL